MLQELLLQAAEIAVIAAAVIISLLALWIVVTIPVWIAAKVLTLGKARFPRAMLVTAVGPVVYAIVFFISISALTVALGGQQAIPAVIALIISFIAWIGVFKKGFDTGWLRAIGIAILAIVVFAIIGVIITVLMQAIVPSAPSITPIPIPRQQV